MHPSSHEHEQHSVSLPLAPQAKKPSRALPNSQKQPAQLLAQALDWHHALPLAHNAPLAVDALK